MGPTGGYAAMLPERGFQSSPGTRGDTSFDDADGLRVYRRHHQGVDLPAEEAAAGAVAALLEVAAPSSRRLANRFLE